MVATMLYRFFFALLLAGVASVSCINVTLSPEITVRELNVRVSVRSSTGKEISRTEEHVEAEFELEFEDQDGFIRTSSAGIALILTPHGEEASKPLLVSEGVER